MIDVRELRKSYGERAAVDGLSFSVAPGEAFGLLGPNGAGKTTTIHMIVGALAPDSGSVLIDGVRVGDDVASRRQVGVVPQDLAVYAEMTAEENLTFFGKLFGLAGAELKERVAQGVEFAGLTDRRKDRVAKYSGGMKRRLNLACALVHGPRVLFCDEPTVGVDPQSRAHLMESIEALRAEGMTMLYTTHAMDEAQRLCDRVAILDHGRLLAIDRVDALIDQHGGASVVEAELTAEPLPGATLPGARDGNRLRIETERPFETIAELGRSGVAVGELKVERPDLERVFLNLTGRSLRDA